MIYGFSRKYNKSLISSSKNPLRKGLNKWKNYFSSYALLFNPPLSKQYRLLKLSPIVLE
jgi:hypothetical protein